MPERNTYGIEAQPAEPLSPASQPTPEVRYSASPGLAAFLAQQDVSLAFSSYQSGKLYLLGSHPDGRLHVNERFFQKAMGICVQHSGTGPSILLATLFQILWFENALNPGERINHQQDACFVPRRSFVTGALDAHDIGVLEDGRPVFVNTLYNCLAVPSERHSFKPVWKPPFISRIIREDRCHLNGLAMEAGRPAYVTAVSRSDTIDGWRDRRSDGGVVIEVATGRIVAEGLSMPHSPRLHRGRLWVLNSGTGELGWIDSNATPAEAFRPLVFCPGFARGLAFHGNYAVVGLSRPRYERFEGLALDQRLAEVDSEPWCGLQIVDLATGTCVHWFRIDGAVTELYDIGLLAGIVCPMALGFAKDEILNFLTHEPLED
ncbi:TIGR03032 family protein [Mesorhizobium sp. BAC0120]|uniref:TIGR03032 family protein n=1 Tax=Mesorhizobium sp. BAC0120 TaxID=3090670 RepID=UPI00298C21AA|nr:TIGR03032 family protein [Mesorhizobium sp. BAC0120]MDW6025619.1 TIGR03032 family protein [Mesorhizobium sp. BAC0120]